MSEIIRILTKNSTCFFCNHKMSFLFAGSKKLELNTESNIVSCFIPLLTKFNAKSSYDYCCTIYFNLDHTFHVSFLRDKKEVDYVPIKILKVFRSLRNFNNLFAFCENCKDFSVTFSPIDFNYSQAKYKKIKKKEEFYCFMINGVRVDVLNNFITKKTNLSIGKNNDISIPMIKEIKKPSQLKDKIEKYLMLI